MAAVVLLAVALVAVSVVAIRERSRGSDARQEVARLEALADRPAPETSTSTTAEQEGGDGPTGLEGLLDDLLGEGGLGQLVGAIAEAVEEDRELSFIDEVDPVYLDSQAFEARIEELTLDGAEERAAAWAGGVSALYTDGDRTSLGLALVERDGGASLCQTIAAWYEAAFGGEAADGDEALVSEDADQAAVVRCRGEEVRVGIGPTLDVARRLAAG